MEKNKNRKGQMSTLPMTIMILVVSIILLVLGLVIIQETRDTDLLSKSAAASYANESITTVDELGTSLSCSGQPAAICSVTLAINASSGTVIPSSNYSLTDCSLAFTSGNSLGVNNTNWNVTYSCTYGGDAYTSTNSSLVGLGDFSDFIPLIVIAIAAGIVVAIVLGSFAARRTR